MIKQLAKEFEREFECLGENTEKYKILSVPIEKEAKKIDKDGNETVVTISHKRKLLIPISTISLSNLIANLPEGIHEIKYKDCFLEYESGKDNLIRCKCLSCNKGYSNKLDEKL